MKTLALLAALALASCSAFTAPKDPITGIHQDAPPEWAGTPNPLDVPVGAKIAKHPALGRMGPHSEFQ